MGQKRCPHCQHLNAADAAFCGECGRSLQGRRCRACGFDGNPPTARFCAGCGKRMGGRPLTLILPLGGLVLLLAAAVVLWQLEPLQQWVEGLRWPAATAVSGAARSSTPSPTPSTTPSSTPSATPTPWPTPSPSSTPTLTATPTPTASPTATPTLPAREVMPIHAYLPLVSRPEEPDVGEMVLIAAGDFTMGMTAARRETVKAICRNEGSTDCTNGMFYDEEPAHEVYLDGYFIDLYEVTNAQFATFVANAGYVTDAERAGQGRVVVGTNRRESVRGADWRHPQGPDSSISGRMQHPVVQVSWNDAAAYCAWTGGRLPTEAEWEKAARGADDRIYPWGDTFRCDGANLDDETTLDSFSTGCADGWSRTAPVGSYPNGQSPYGLLDMAGNAYEWVSDWYGDSYYENSPRTYPTGPTRGEYRAYRGGCWFSDRTWSRVTDRRGLSPNLSSDLMGFRCARDAR